MNRVLVSFHFHSRSDLDDLVQRAPGGELDLFGDSGAFSAWSTGADISVDDYAAWLHKWKHLLSAYVTLDAIGDNATTHANQQALESMGLEPVPVFHGNEPWPALEEYCERYPYVALGGMVGANKAYAWIVKCFTIAARYGTVFHGFGQTKRLILRELPWYSVDSSSWGSGHRYGMLTLWDPRSQKLVRAKTGDHADVFRSADLIRDHGGDPELMATPNVGQTRFRGKEQASIDRHAIIAINAEAWRRSEQLLSARHGVVERRDGLGVGPRLYLAAGGFEDAVVAAGGVYEPVRRGKA